MPTQIYIQLFYRSSNHRNSCPKYQLTGQLKSTSPTTGATVNLTNSDFNNETLRITTGNCVFKLTENISIQPGTSPDFFPTESTEFPFPPYQLGWFAGITVETTDGVVIDLNGFA